MLHQHLKVGGLSVTCWNCQRLRCSSCGGVHTAKPPVEALGPKFDETAIAMLMLCRYGTGLPHNRLAHMQKHMRLPVPASTQWEAILENAPALEPVFGELERQGAQGDTMHNDDTCARILEFMGERRAKNPQGRRAARSGARRIVHHSHPVPHSVAADFALLHQGRKHAGENLAELLDGRDEELEPPILMSDGLETRSFPVFGAAGKSETRADAVDRTPLVRGHPRIGARRRR